MVKQRKKKQTSSSKAWSGRFTKKPDPRAEAFSSSLAVDIRLLPYDIVGSLAHAEMLARRKIIPVAEARRLQQGLKKILAEWETEKLTVRAHDEDVHMLVERRLRELLLGTLH